MKLVPRIVIRGPVKILLVYSGLLPVPFLCALYYNSTVCTDDLTQ